MKENRILVVDDSKTFLLYISDILKELPNVIIKWVEDPRTCIDTIVEFSPHVILTDFEMPFINGNEICRLIKTDSKLSTIPIMMLSSNNTEDQLIRAIDFGADDFLFKGSKKEIIEIKIKSLLRYKRLIDQDIEAKQLMAVKALIATSNHEFNNALFISNGYLNKMRKSAKAEELETIEKIAKMNKRIQDVVARLENLKNISLENYGHETNMLKI